jgi:hypothetical protein
MLRQRPVCCRVPRARYGISMLVCGLGSVYIAVFLGVLGQRNVSKPF